MGFTAINNPQDTAQKDPGHQQVLPWTREELKKNDTQLAVSEYLGRGDDDASVSINQALHGPGTKKAAANDKGCQGKKRVSKAKAPAKNKRCKTDLVESGLCVAQPLTNATEMSPVSLDLREVLGDLPENHAIEVQSIPVYAPATSMNMLNGTTPQTSVSALNSASVRSSTLYRRASIQGQTRTRVSYAEPLINEDDNEKVDDGGKRGRRSVDITGTAKNSLHFAEDFMNDDLDEDSIAVLAEAVEQDRALLPIPDDLFLPAPDTFDAPVYSSATREKKSEGEQVTSISIENDDELHDKYNEILPDTIVIENDNVHEQDGTLQSRDRKFNIRDVDNNEDYEEALLSEAERGLLAKLKLASSRGEHKPVFRSRFPCLIQHRTPIFGASSATILRTCFRTGEALKEGIQAVRNNRNVVLELYARVTQSRREGRKQHFVFKDLYHDKPPHLGGTFELWSQSPLWDADSKVFSMPKDGGRMCRLVGRMRRVEMKWMLEVISIWEASWEDVDFVAGIFAKKHGFLRV